MRPSLYPRVPSAAADSTLGYRQPSHKNRGTLSLTRAYPEFHSGLISIVPQKTRDFIYVDSSRWLVAGNQSRWR